MYFILVSDASTLKTNTFCPFSSFTATVSCERTEGNAPEIASIDHSPFPILVVLTRFLSLWRTKYSETTDFSPFVYEQIARGVPGTGSPMVFLINIPGETFS